MTGEPVESNWNPCISGLDREAGPPDWMLTGEVRAFVQEVRAEGAWC
jgi:hypothetical protein